MDIDVSFNGESLPITVENPFRMDPAAVAGQIEDFLRERGAPADGLELEGLLPRMVRGVAGCEAGCPADAHRVVREGFGDYKLAYVEGGILTAARELDGSRRLEIRMFPDF